MSADRGVSSNIPTDVIENSSQEVDERFKCPFQTGCHQLKERKKRGWLECFFEIFYGSPFPQQNKVIVTITHFSCNSDFVWILSFNLFSYNSNFLPSNLDFCSKFVLEFWLHISILILSLYISQFCNCDFYLTIVIFPCNCEFISCNSDFISHLAIHFFNKKKLLIIHTFFPTI